MINFRFRYPRSLVAHARVPIVRAGNDVAVQASPKIYFTILGTLKCVVECSRMLEIESGEDSSRLHARFRWHDNRLQCFGRRRGQEPGSGRDQP